MKIRVVAPRSPSVRPSAPTRPQEPSGSGVFSPDRFKSRAIVQQTPAPPESLWYRFKKAVLDYVCNIDFKSARIERLTSSAAFQVQPLLRPGDILLRRTEGTSGNLFIPSWWKHAAVYTGKGDVVEATFHGVEKNRLEEFFTHGDHVVILRPKTESRADRKAIARFAEAQIGKPYDFDFDFADAARVSCTELAYHALRAGTGKAMVPMTWYGSVVGDDFLNAENFELVWASKDVTLS